MWNTLLDNAKKVADKAKAAAENLEDQLNESVGATPEVLATRSFDKNKNTGAGAGNLFNSFGRGLLTAISDNNDGDDDEVEDDDAFFNDDPFYEDDFDVDVNMHENEKTEALDSSEVDNESLKSTDENDNIKEITIEEENEEEEVETTTETEKESVYESSPSTPCNDGENKESLQEVNDQEQNLEPDDDQSDTVEFFQQSNNDLIEKENEQILPLDADESSLTAIGIDEATEIVHIVIDNDNHDFVKENEIPTDSDKCSNDKRPIVTDTELVGNDTPIKSDEFHQNGDVEDTKKEQLVDEVIDDDIDEENDISELYDDNEIDEVIGDHNIDNMEQSDPIDNNVEEINTTYENEDIPYTDNDINEIYDDNKSNEGINDRYVDTIEESEVIDSNLKINVTEEQRDVLLSNEHHGYESEEDDLSVYVSKEEAMANEKKHSQLAEKLHEEISELQNRLNQREHQLTEKAKQIFSMAETYEKEKSFLEAKVRETKDEAKKRIGKAKERVDSMQAKLAEALAKADTVGSSSNEQEEIIKALRKEGETLAMKQSKMEELVRDTRSELRGVKEALENETEEKEKALEKIDELTQQLTSTKNQLSAARENQGRAEKLDSDLLIEREEREKNASKILSLEATIKEMKAKHADKIKDMEARMSSQVSRVESEKSIIGKEKDNLIKDLELKLRTSEKEANLREDSLRHELTELRKRWQDSVRRSDGK